MEDSVVPHFSKLKDGNPAQSVLEEDTEPPAPLMHILMHQWSSCSQNGLRSTSLSDIHSRGALDQGTSPHPLPRIRHGCQLTATVLVGVVMLACPSDITLQDKRNKKGSFLSFNISVSSSANIGLSYWSMLGMFSAYHATKVKLSVRPMRNMGGHWCPIQLNISSTTVCFFPPFPFGIEHDTRCSFWFQVTCASTSVMSTDCRPLMSQVHIYRP